MKVSKNLLNIKNSVSVLRLYSLFFLVECNPLTVVCVSTTTIFYKNAILNNKIFFKKKKKIEISYFIGIFYGKQSESNFMNSEILPTLVSFEVFSPTEHMTFYSECQLHNGVHLWLDKCIPETLLTDKNETQLIRQASPGTKGELILTNFNKALPLIRYQTGKKIAAISSDVCTAGVGIQEFFSHKKLIFRIILY